MNQIEIGINALKILKDAVIETHTNLFDTPTITRINLMVSDIEKRFKNLP